MPLLISWYFFNNVLNHRKVIDVLIVFCIQVYIHFDSKSTRVLFHLIPFAVHNDNLFAHFIDQRQNMVIFRLISKLFLNFLLKFLNFSMGLKHISIWIVKLIDLPFVIWEIFLNLLDILMQLGRKRILIRLFNNIRKIGLLSLKLGNFFIQ